MIERLIDKKGNWEIVKIGISGGSITKDGRSYRAESQVSKWTREGSGKFRSRIIVKDICGRPKASKYEKFKAQALRRQGLLHNKVRRVNGKKFHTRP